MQNILKKWNIQGEVKQIYKTAWSVSNEYVLKVYDDLENLQRNEQILKILYERSIPVAEIVNLSDGNGYYEEGTKYYFLTKKLRGNNIANIKDNLHMPYIMGQVIAQLHLAFEKCEEKLNFWDNSLLDEMNGWVRRNLSNSNWNLIKEEEFNTTVSMLDNAYEELPKQLIHRDVNFGNFLFDGDEFTGYIDFDLSQRNIRIFDISYFLIGLLSKEAKNELKKDEWYKIVQDVIKGYENHSNLLEIEKGLIPCVMKNIELLFVAYFTSIGNEQCAIDAVKLFEFVQHNEQEIVKLIHHE